MITGGASGGMLGNQLYIGKLVWNAFRQVKNPENGKRNNRKTRPEDHIVVDVPHLRIIPQGLWDSVQAVRNARRTAKQQGGPRVHKPKDKGDRLLLGLLKCSVCGGQMMIGQSNMDGSPRVVCSYGARRMNCTHHKSYCLKTLKATVFDGIKSKLTDRKALVELTRAYHDRWAERQREVRDGRDAAQKQLNRVTVQIDRIVTAISDSDEPVKALVDKLNALEVERAGLTEKIRLIEAEGNVVTLHPAALDQFSTAMEELHEALTSDLDSIEQAPFRAAFYNVFERIVVHPTGKRKPYEVTPYARIAALMGFELLPKIRSASEMLAEQGVYGSEQGVSANGLTAPTGSCKARD